MPAAQEWLIGAFSIRKNNEFCSGGSRAGRLTFGTRKRLFSRVSRRVPSVTLCRTDLAFYRLGAFEARGDAVAA